MTEIRGSGYFPPPRPDAPMEAVASSSAGSLLRPNVFSETQVAHIIMVDGGACQLLVELLRNFPHLKVNGERRNFRAWRDYWEEYVLLVQRSSSDVDTLCC